MELKFDFWKARSIAEQVMVHPKKFFRSSLYKKEKGISQAFYYYALLSLWLTVGSYLFTALTGSREMASVAAISYVSGLVFLLVMVFLLNVLIKVFKGKGEFEKTFRMYVYSLTPTYLVGFVPGLSFLAGIYGLYILVIGTMDTYSFSPRKVIAMYLVGVVLSILLVGLLSYAALRIPLL